MHRRATTAILMTVTGTVLAGGLAMTVVALDGGPELGKVAYDSVTATTGYPTASEHDTTTKTEQGRQTLCPPKSKAKAKKKPKKKRVVAGTSRGSERKSSQTKGLPSGISTATSFWDPETASGKPMSYETLASPYWPLGTKVRVTYHGKSATGEVQDFGPAEWAVRQHDPPAIIDLSEKMMADLTGTRSNSVPMRFQVLKFGDGARYQRSGTGFDLAWGK